MRRLVVLYKSIYKSKYLDHHLLRILHRILLTLALLLQGGGRSRGPYLLLYQDTVLSSLAHVKRIGQSNGGFKMSASRDDTGFSVVDQMTMTQEDQHNTVVFRVPELSDLQQQIAHAGRPKATASVRVGQA